MSLKVFKDQVVVITGASSGIGYELSLQLAEAGARLCLAARNADRLQALAEECSSRGVETLVVPTDVTDQEQCRSLVDRSLERFGRIDTLINNAGLSMWCHFEEVEDLSIFEDIMRVNYMGSVYCTHYALPWLKESGGRIVGVSSLSGKNGVPTRSGYAASKHAMVGFFDTLRIELAQYGISVTMAFPDFVATDIRRNAMNGTGGRVGHTVVEDNPKVMSASECARLILAGAARRKREVLMSFRSKIGVWIKLIAPGLIDSIARRAIEHGK